MSNAFQIHKDIIVHVPSDSRIMVKHQLNLNDRAMKKMCAVLNLLFEDDLRYESPFPKEVAEMLEWKFIVALRNAMEILADRYDAESEKLHESSQARD